VNKTRATLALLRAYESRNVTFVEPEGSWPIVWERARGVHVWDAEGRGYLDLTAAFGVAAAGHANARVVRAGQRQMSRLLHAMGDVHPHALKAQLARELSRLTFERWADAESLKRLTVEGSKRAAVQRSNAVTLQRCNAATLPRSKTIFCNSGFEAVEAALKTALLATGKRGVIAFEGAYHGLGYGALNATHREHFRARFRAQLGGFAYFVPFPAVGGGSTDQRRARLAAKQALAAVEAAIVRLFKRYPVGAILVEPVQGRAGIRVPPQEFLPLLRALCEEHGALLIADEIFTGLGRTGRWFACEHSETVPDVVCLGKALTGGFPLSACVGRAALMDAAWPPSSGEAIHTSTYLGHPVGCAMALAQIAELRSNRLVQRSARLGAELLEMLAATRPRAGLRASTRGLGLMVGLELLFANGSAATEACFAVIKAMLRRGFILLPEGEHANVISFTPPLTVPEPFLRRAVGELQAVLNDLR
jgi:4-aminobutyrate aminotransferase-like enzyme